MANDAERRGYFKACYHRVLAELPRVKLENPAAYDEMVKAASNIRDWVKNVAEIDDLPEPK